MVLCNVTNNFSRNKIFIDILKSCLNYMKCYSLTFSENYGPKDDSTENYFNRFMAEILELDYHIKE